MKNKRNIKTFEPDPDVLAMLATAQKGGLATTEIVNKSVRQFGRRFIRDCAREKIAQLKELASGSFKVPAHQSAGEVALTE